MPADLTSRVRAKLAEVKHAEDCDTVRFVLEQQVRHCETGDFLTLKPHCTCDRAARVAGGRIGERGDTNGKDGWFAHQVAIGT